MLNKMADEDALDLSDWDDVLCAEPEDVEKPKDKNQNINSLGDEEDDDWNDVIAIEVFQNYCSTLMKQMEVFRRQGTLCDAVIVADDQDFPVHKNILSAVSPFFKNIFSQLTSPEDSRITLRNISGNVMDDILHFTYTGEVGIHDGNVRQLLATANFIKLQGLKDMAIEYLDRKLSPGSAAEILILAAKHNCGNLVQLAEKLVSNNFVIVSKTDGFKKMPFEMLHQFIKSEDIRVVREEEVFEAVMAWAKSDFGFRSEKDSQLVELLHEIRFPLISPSYVTEVIQKDELIQRNNLCAKIVSEAENYRLQNANNSLIESKLMRPRKFMGVVTGLVCVGGWQQIGPTRDVFTLVTSSLKWFPLTPLPKARYCHSVISCDGSVYVVGGRDESTRLLTSVLQFEPSYNKWNHVTSLPYGAASIGACVFKGQIYCVGGLSSVGSIDTVVRYSSRYNSWQRVVGLKCPRGASAVVASDKHMFAIGGIKKSGDGVNAQWNFLNTMEIFEREPREAWSFGAELLSKRAHGSVACINEILYLIGGQSELTGSHLGMDLYNITAREWSSMPFYGVPRSMSGVAVSESNIYIIGGVSKDGESITTVETLDTFKNRLKLSSPLPAPVSSIQCCSLQLPLAVLQGMSTSFSE